MNEVCLNTVEAMDAYNNFHHSYPDYKNNEFCSPDSIMLRNKLERFLVENGK